MKKQLLLLILGILLLTGVASATTVLSEREVKLQKWVTNPCIEQGIQVGQNISLFIYPISCQINDNAVGCSNLSVEVIVDYGTAHSKDSGVINLASPVFCTRDSNCPNKLTPIPQSNFWYEPNVKNLFFGTDGQQYDSWGQFGFKFNTPGPTLWQYIPLNQISFGYIPLYTAGYNTTNQYYNGFANVSLLLDTPGYFSMKIIVKDLQYPSLPILTRYFNYTVVATDGVVAGQCTSTNSAGSEPITNPITTLFGEWQGLVWFIMMFLLAVFLMFISRGNLKVGLGITLFAELIMLLIGAWLHIVSAIWLLLFGVGVCVAIAMFIRKGIA
ncbi:MAG: hypothetical protein NTY03_05220 [Candidatus Bathyarchaeota archaeon]|nr:hypothetical protein [Candidatus Bathyarchaeota archaeon]